MPSTQGVSFCGEVVKFKGEPDHIKLNLPKGGSTTTLTGGNRNCLKKQLDGEKATTALKIAKLIAMQELRNTIHCPEEIYNYAVAEYALELRGDLAKHDKDFHTANKFHDKYKHIPAVISTSSPLAVSRTRSPSSARSVTATRRRSR